MAKLNYNQIPAALANRQSFTGNSMHAERVADIFWVSTGRLSEDEISALRSVKGPAYVVFSYGTPIAWITDSGVKHIVSQKFSVTTSRQQTLVMVYL